MPLFWASEIGMYSGTQGEGLWEGLLCSGTPQI
jgi:hypothetical protein